MTLFDTELPDDAVIVAEPTDAKDVMNPFLLTETTCGLELDHVRLGLARFPCLL
jgi:hypothetical protein